MGCCSSKQSQSSENRVSRSTSEKEIAEVQDEGQSKSPSMLKHMSHLKDFFSKDKVGTSEDDNSAALDESSPDFEEPLHLQESRTVLEPGLTPSNPSQTMVTMIKRLSMSILHDPRMVTTASESVAIPESDLLDQEDKIDSVDSGEYFASHTTLPNSDASFVTGKSTQGFPSARPAQEIVPADTSVEQAVNDGLSEDVESQESLTVIPGYAGSLRPEHPHHVHPLTSKDCNHNGPDSHPSRSNNEIHSTSPANDDSEENEDTKSTTLLPSAGFLATTSTSSPPQYPVGRIPEEESERNDNEKLLALIKVACSATDYSSLYDVAANATALHLQRTTCFSPESSEILSTLVASVKCLKKLNISKNNAGPVAFRAVLVTLIKHDCVQELDISDNMSDSECAGLIGKLVATSSTLVKLNLSGNQLGKESLSRSLSESININCTLVHLNISGCGASNLHGLLEGIRAACSKGLSCLRYLDISNNHINDPLQFGIDTSLVLEHENCKLTHFNLENTGMNPLGWKTLRASLKTNTSLREFVAGGSYNKVQNLVELADILLANKSIVRISFNGIKVEQKLMMEETWFEFVNPPVMALSQLELNDCSLGDEFFIKLSTLVAGKFYNVVSVNISNNNNLTEAGLSGLNRILSGNEESQLYSLEVAGLNLDFLPDFFENHFPNLASISIGKARISSDSLSKLFICSQVLREVSLDGIKMSGSGILEVLFVNNSNHHFTKISLRGCALTDKDLGPLVTAIGRHGPPLTTLLYLDLSVNRLTSAIVQQIFAALLSCTNHRLEVLDLSNNAIEDSAACEAAHCILSPSCKSNLKRLDLSGNDLSKNGIEALVRCMASNPEGRGLFSLDVSNQNNPLGEEELESVIETLATSLGMHGALLLPEDEKQPIPFLSSNLNINLTELGGSAGPRTRMLDSVAIKTDFTKVCRTSASLSDFLLIGAGLDRASQSGTSDDPKIDAVQFTAEEWSSVVGENSPAWLKVDEDRKKGVYISHLPASATIQRLEGMLEMEADCDISDSYLVKDPVLRKPTGSAWILFANEKSVKQAIQWYTCGEAQMYGTPFCISRLPVSVSGGDEERVKSMAEREKLSRENQRKQNDENDRVMMEESQQLAEERATYRESHPAYENGRIW